MRLQFLGKTGSKSGDCPTLYATDRDTYLVQGWRTSDAGTVEIPHALLGFAQPDTFIGSPMTDSRRGTFLVSGRPVAERDVLEQLTLAVDETAIEVAKSAREFYGVGE